MILIGLENVINVLIVIFLEAVVQPFKAPVGLEVLLKVLIVIRPGTGQLIFWDLL